MGAEMKKTEPNRKAWLAFLAKHANLVKTGGGKFSEPLHRWLKLISLRGASSPYLIRVWKHDQSLFIGYASHDNMIGSNQWDVFLGGGHAKISCYANVSRFKEIKTWWSRYFKLGKCAIDPRHFHYHQRWQMRSKTLRQCRWCALEQREVTHVERREVKTWIPVTAKARKKAA